MFEGLKKKIISSLSERESDNLPPQQFFSNIKDKQQPVTKEMLDLVRISLIKEIQDFLENGQIDSAERLLFHLNCVEKEQAVIDAGFNRFVYRDDLDIFITSVSKKVVKIIDLAHYERKIPDKQAKVIRTAKPLFDEVYIVFTDYTGKEERKVKKKDQAKDPIAFGAFKSKDNKVWNHRFYYICDWTDKYCDLTLDKYISEMIMADHLDPVHTATDITVADLENRIKAAREANPDNDNSFLVSLTHIASGA